MDTPVPSEVAGVCQVIDVIIPARDEADTIGEVVRAFRRVDYIGTVIVVSNGPHPYLTALAAANEGAFTRQDDSLGGKGQAVRLGLEWVETEYVCLCDADLTGLRSEHVRSLTYGHPDHMTVGVPDRSVRNPVPWPVSDEVWAANSGERCLPTSLARGLDLHGYCMETQINHAAKKAGIPVRYVRLEGVTGKIRNNAVRMAELRRDRDWLHKNWKE